MQRGGTTLTSTLFLRRALPPTLLLSAALPALVWAEGAVRVLNCQTTQVCDAIGHCRTDGETLSLRMTPKALRSDGSGEFMLHYQDRDVPMETLSEAGPFVWQLEHDRYTLLANSSTQFLLHKLSLAAEPTASVQFMTCSFR
jgi:hypothetical protein